MKKVYIFLSLMIAMCFQAQTHYSQDFNTTGLNSWVNTDLNNDTYVWQNLNASSINAAFGTGALVSRSWINNTVGGVTPNNLITSPLINLSAAPAANLKLIFNLYSHPNWPAEKFSVYVTTTNVAANIITTTPVYTETATGGFQTRTVDLSAFAGQQVYLSFRHYDCFDQYYLIIDNIEVKNPLSNDVAVKSVDMKKYGLINTDYTMSVKLKNNGTNAINNVTLNWNDGTDHIATIPTPSLAVGAETTITHTIPVNYSTVVEKNINVTLTQVNGVADNTPLDNTAATSFRTVSQNSPKKVLIEEGTGTWCGFCPRGAVAMAYMDANYPNDFVGIAVHNGDPMAVTEYNAGAGIASFPGMNVDRVNKGVTVTQAEMVSQVNTRKTLVVPAALNGSGTLAGGVFTFNASATFRTVYSNANLKFAVVLMEDGVTGTTNPPPGTRDGYSQVNYYAGGTNGVMGGYELKPDPVPASQMVYDHVGRVLMGGYSGADNSVPAVISDGQVVNYTFTATIPAAYNTANMKAVLLLLDGVTGEVLNARSFALSALLSTVEATNENYLNVYPNPASEYFKIQADKNVDIMMYDGSGKLVLEKKNVRPDQPIFIQGFAKGMYIVTLKERDGKIKNHKLIIK